MKSTTGLSGNCWVLRTLANLITWFGAGLFWRSDPQLWIWRIFFNFIPSSWLFHISFLVTSIQTFRSYPSSPGHQLFSHNMLKTTTHLLWNSEDTEDFALWSSLCLLELENLLIDSVLWRTSTSEDAENRSLLASVVAACFFNRSATQAMFLVISPENGLCCLCRMVWTGSSHPILKA